MRLKLFVFSLLSLSVLAAWLYVPTAIASVLISRTGYWFILASVVCFVYCLVQYLRRREIRRLLSKYWGGLLLAAVGTLIVEVHEPREFKVLYDEFSLSGTAMTMHYVRDSVFPIRMHNVGDRPELLEAGVDKRPLLFPFAIACLHDLTGYRPENVFLLNGIVCFLTVFMIYYFGFQHGGWRMGTAGVALWLSLPLFAQCATSGGYDAMNVFMILVLWYFGREYLRTGERLAQNLFVFSGVLLAQVRYESILALVAVAMIIVVRWYRDRSWRLTWGAVLVPIHVFMPLMINAYFRQNPVFMQTEPGQAYFSAAYFQENIGRGAFFLFNLNFALANSAILSVVGTIGSAALLARVLSHWRQIVSNGDAILLFAIGVFVSINLQLIMLNFWGQLDDPAAARFALPLYLLFIMAAMWFAGDLLRDRPLPTYVFIVVLPFMVMSISVSSAYTATRTFVRSRAYTWMLEEIQKPEHRGALVLSQPIGPILYGHPAVPVGFAESNKWKINECIKAKVYPEVLVLELYSVDYKTGGLIPGNEDQSLSLTTHSILKESEKTTLSAAFTRELVGEIRLRPSMIVRLSRVTGVIGSDAEPPESYKKDIPPYKTIWEYNRHIYSILP